MTLSLADILTLEGPGGQIAHVALRLPSANLVTRELAALLRTLPEEIDQGLPHVRAVVLSGPAGGPFCEGAAQSFYDEAKGLTGADALAHVAAYQVASAVAAIQRPVIAAIEGAAYEQGFEIALAADLRVAGESATFRLGQVGQGLIPWDGGTQRLRRIAGQPVALDLILTGRTIAAREALDLGLVDRAAPASSALAVAMDLAAAIARGAPLAARYAKEVVRSGLDMTLEHGILLETDLTMVLQTTADRAEGIRSFLERRKPEFTGQ